MTVVLSLPRWGLSDKTDAHRGLRILVGLTVVAGVLSLIARAFIGLQSSLWLDESWTGAFATEPTLGAVTQQIRDDANAPLYYYLIWAWAKLFGVSNIALRIPGVLFSLAAPLIAWAGLRQRWPSTALVWAALLALWIPGIELSGYARCYTLLVLVGTANAVAYLRALESPTLGRTAVWVAAASLAVLTHYHAAFLALAEAVIFLAVHRQRVLQLWPAALVTLPALGWIAYHAPRLEQFSRPEVAWYNRLAVTDMPLMAAYLLGSATACMVVVAALLFAALLGARAAAEDPAAPAAGEEKLGALWLPGLASALAAAACLIVACIRPSFAIRYLTPFVPGALLLVACAVDRLGRGRWEPKAALILAVSGLSLLWMSRSTGDGERLYSFERASAYLAQARPDRLAFYWDHPATPFEAPGQLDRVGGFFLRRAGHPVTVAPVYPAANADMTAVALVAAGPHGAILWMYDTAVHGTRAATDPPEIEDQDPSFVCKDFGAGPVGVLACRKKATS